MTTEFVSLVLFPLTVRNRLQGQGLLNKHCVAKWCLQEPQLMPPWAEAQCKSSDYSWGEAGSLKTFRKQWHERWIEANCLKNVSFVGVHGEKSSWWREGCLVWRYLLLWTLNFHKSNCLPKKCNKAGRLASLSSSVLSFVLVFFSVFSPAGLIWWETSLLAAVTCELSRLLTVPASASTPSGLKRSVPAVHWHWWL